MEHLLSAGHSYRQAVSGCYPDAICLLGQNPQSPRSELCSGCAFEKCLPDPDKLIKEFWNIANNPNKASVNEPEAVFPIFSGSGGTRGWKNL